MVPNRIVVIFTKLTLEIRKILIECFIAIVTKDNLSGDLYFTDVLQNTHKALRYGEHTGFRARNELP